MRVQKSVTLDEDIFEWAKKKAEDNRISLSDVLNQELAKVKNGGAK